MRIVLVGSGIGGLAAALSLPAQAEVALLEQAERLDPVGAGIQLGPNAMQVLTDLGLCEDLMEFGFAPDAVRIRRASDQDLMLQQTLGAWAADRWGAPYLQVHRADLQAVLLQAVRARSNCTLRLGAKMTDLRQLADGVVVTLEDGRTIEADAVIGCDGLRSATRRLLWGENRPRFTGQTAWRGVVEASRLPPGLIEPVAAVWTGPTRHFVHYYVRGGAAVNFVGVVERDEAGAESWLERGDAAELAQDFAGWPEPVRAIIAAAAETWRWALYDRPPLPRWTKGRVTLLGDAAHPMTPFLAQGAAMAIEDAQALGRALSASSDVEQALQAYERARRSRATRVQAASRRNARLFHLPDAAAGAAFGVARALDRLNPAAAAARFDWLYGWKG